jgi:hypothetical protein
MRVIQAVVLLWLITFAASLPGEELPLPRDIRSADIRISEAGAEIKAVIAELRKDGDVKEADRIAGRFKEIRSLLTGEFREPGEDLDVEMHAVGVYRGEVPPEVERTVKHPIGYAEVRVTYTGRPMILVLTAYEPVAWNVRLAEGVKIQKVVCCGHYAQDVTGLPKDVPVEGKGDSRGEGVYAHQPEQLEGRFGDYLRKNFGMQPVSFQVSHAYRGTPFVVGPENAQWRSEKVWQQLEPFHREVTAAKRAALIAELKKIRFPTIHIAVAADRFHADATSLATFNPLGPIKSSLKPLEKPCRQVVLDTDATRYYGVTPAADRTVVEIDPATGKFTDLGVPELSRLERDGYLAYDSKRKRLLVASKQLTSYEPATRKVTLLAAAPGDLAGLAYAADEDVIYALVAPYDGNLSASRIKEVLKLNEHGAVIERIPLQRPIPAGTHFVETRLTAQGGKLIILPCVKDFGEGPRAAPASYVIDAKDGKQLFAAMISAQDE